MKGRGVFTLATFLLLFSFSLNLGFNQARVSEEASNGYPIRNLNTGLNYTSIQKAIDAPETWNGHTLFVEEGIYYENLVINKSLTLSGENTKNTIIDGMRKDHVIRVIADNVKITCFTIRNSSWQAGPGPYRSGIYIDASDHSNVTQNELTDNLDGINIDRSFNTTIRLNNMTANSWIGVELVDSSNSTISENNILATKGDGIKLENSSYNIIYKNTLVNSTVGGIRLRNSPNNEIYENNITTNSFQNTFGIWLIGSSKNNISGNIFENCGMIVDDSFNSVVENNLVNKKSLVYLEGVSNYTIQDAGQVIAINSNEIHANNLNLSNATVGIQMWKTNNSEIRNNTIVANSFCGVILEQSRNNIISENNITSNHDAVRVGWFGGSSSNNTISRNNITNNTYGVYLGFSSNSNILSSNDIKDNYWTGIYIYSSSNNVISGNSVINNRPGIYLVNSNDNRVFHNNFFNNGAQAYILDSISVWDDGYPSGGNYWSDYNGTDLFNGPYQNENGSDGLGDKTYSVYENNTDNYPLMGMFYSFNTSQAKHVNVICNSTVDAFEYIHSTDTINLLVSNSSTEQTQGFIRICIPHVLMNETYHVIVNGTEPYYVNYNLADNGTHRWLYFTYEHSTLEIVITSEFQSLIILSLFMAITLLAAIVYKKHS